MGDAAETKDTPGVIAPPVLIFLAFLGLAWLLHHLGLRLPTGLTEAARRGLAAVLLGAALALLVGALGHFRRAATDARPWKPTTAIVLRGPYRWTRNPMYLGMTLIYLASGLLMDSLVPLLLLVPLVWIVNWGVIEPEERYLEARFADEYRQYQRRVRRWL